MAQNVMVCDIAKELKADIRKFRFTKDQFNAALIMKIDREKQLVCLDEILENVDIDDLRESLPGHQPRYVIFSHKVEHSDGRISYPLVFIYITPRDCQPELQMMYAGTKLAIVREADVAKVYEIRDLEELTTEWLDEKMGKN